MLRFATYIFAKVDVTLRSIYILLRACLFAVGYWAIDTLTYYVTLRSIYILLRACLFAVGYWAIDTLTYYVTLRYIYLC